MVRERRKIIRVIFNLPLKIFWDVLWIIEVFSFAFKIVRIESKLQCSTFFLISRCIKNYLRKPLHSFKLQFIHLIEILVVKRLWIKIFKYKLNYIQISINLVSWVFLSLNWTKIYETYVLKLLNCLSNLQFSRILQNTCYSSTQKWCSNGYIRKSSANSSLKLINLKFLKK